MTGTGQRVSNIRDISEVNYTLGLNHVASAGLSCFGALDNLWSWDFPRGRGVNTISNGGLHERRSEEHTSELQSQSNLVCRLLLEKKKKNNKHFTLVLYHYVEKYQSSLDGQTFCRNSVVVSSHQ